MRILSTYCRGLDKKARRHFVLWHDCPVTQSFNPRPPHELSALSIRGATSHRGNRATRPAGDSRISSCGEVTFVPVRASAQPHKLRCRAHRTPIIFAIYHKAHPCRGSSKRSALAKISRPPQRLKTAPAARSPPPAFSATQLCARDSQLSRILVPSIASRSFCQGASALEQGPHSTSGRSTGTPARLTAHRPRST